MGDEPKERTAAMNATPLGIYGAGGFTLQILASLDRIRDTGREVVIVDDRPLPPVYGYPVKTVRQLPSNTHYLIAIASGETRKRVAERMENARFDTLIADHALVSPYANLGVGNIICEQAVIEAGATIGRHFHANIFSYVAHECVIGDYVTFAPRVSCNGNVHIGDLVQVGTGVLIRQGTRERPLRIGTGAVLQMGCVITRDVEDHALVKANMVH